MIGALLTVLTASLGATANDRSEIRINLVASVPVTCSMGQVISSTPSRSGLRVTLAGNCNTDHVVRVSLAQAAPPASAARLNGTNGLPGPRDFAFVRPAYFAANSLLELDFDEDAIDPAMANTDLVVEVSPV
jgi:hypothetical protein